MDDGLIFPYLHWCAHAQAKLLLALVGCCLAGLLCLQGRLAGGWLVLVSVAVG
jgi:hypothetical protein